MGQVYVDVSAAQAELGFSTLDGSMGGGAVSSALWLYWTEKGYTGTGWYWNDPNNYVKTGWGNYLSSGKLTCGVEHANDESGLSDHIAGGHAEDLNDILGSWPESSKYLFVGTYYDKLTRFGCLANA